MTTQAAVEPAPDSPLVSVLPGCKVQYGYTDHNGHPQHRIYTEEDGAFRLLCAEDFSFRTMQPMNAAAERAKSERERFEQERESNKLASAQTVDALQAKVNNLEKQLAALIEALQPKPDKKK